MRTVEANWKPLEEKLGPSRCHDFMYIVEIDGIHHYKHRITRTYLFLDDSGNCFRWSPHSGFENADFATELSKLEADLRTLGATLSPTA
jgi:hypothetical protein